ncbi:MAG: beta-galactosidase [Candidatus Omnitrophica bacterium]|nr:beta-galactosidase [Candidatus Omnitrophota bacterium]
MHILRRNAVLVSGLLFSLVFLAGCGSTSAEPKFYPEKISCPGPAVTVKEHNGVPTVFFDGKPDARIMTNPTVKWGTGIMPVVSKGELLLTNKPGNYTYRSLTTTNSFSGACTVEAAVKVNEITGNGGNITLIARAQYERATRLNAYLLSLSENNGVRNANLWKEEKGAEGGYRKWFTVSHNWETGKIHILKISFDGKEVSGFVDGKLIGKQVDENPIPSGKVELSVYHSVSAVDRVSVEKPDGAALLSDDFSSPRSWDWNGTPLQKAKTYPEIGVHIYTAAGWGGTDWWSQCWLGPGKYDFSKIDRDFENLLKEDPEALIFPRVYLNAPEWWLKAHPEEAAVICHADGSSAPSRFPSFTSQLWLKDTGEFLRQYIRHLNSSPYGERYIGFLVGGGHAMEWVYNWGPYFHDYSENQLNAYTAWLKTIYPDVNTLREAWKDPDITFETVNIPSVKERRKGDFYNFYDPAKGRKIIDYRRFHSIAVSDAVSYMSKIVNEETQGKRIATVAYGYVLNSHTVNSYMDMGHFNLARVLECPYVDAMVSPHIYTGRLPGGFAMSPVPVDSVLMHGKVFFDEDDIRTHLAAKTPLNDSEGRAQNLFESINVFKRDFAYTISKGMRFWYMDWGNGWYHDDAIMDAIGQIQELATESLEKKREKTSEIALIVSEQSTDYLSTEPGLLQPLFKQVFNEFTRIGTPLDAYLISDLDKIPDYKMYVFLNAFYLTEKDRKAIKETVLGKNHTVLWMYAPGYVTNKGLSPEAVTDITGIKVEMHDAAGEFAATLSGKDHAITRELDPQLSWKSGEGPFGPLFYCSDAGASTLAVLSGGVRGDCMGKPALAVKEMDGWRSIWCGMPNMPSALLRQIAKEAGVHIYSDYNDVVYANNFLLSVAVKDAGEREIRLPAPAKVVDAFTGEVISEKTDSFKRNFRQFEAPVWWLEY